MKNFVLNVVLALIFCWGVSAQNYSGKELVRAEDVNAALETGLGLLFGAKDIDGDIVQVKVLEHSKSMVELSIDFEGFEGNWLKVSLLDTAKLPIRWVKSIAVQLDPTHSPVTVRLENTRPEEVTASRYLKLLVCKKERDVSGKVFYYHFEVSEATSTYSSLSGKKEPDYKKPGLVLAVRPSPVGSAKQLGNRNGTWVLPSRILKTPVKKEIYTQPILRKSMVLQPALKQPKMVGTQDPVKAPRIGNLQAIRALPEVQKKEEQTNKSPTLSLSNLTLRPVNLKALQLNQEELDKGAQGPGKMAIVLWDEIRSDVDFDFGNTQLSTISTDIFPDKNEKSGFYYYFPASYNLEFNPDETYQLKLLYGSGTESESGKVRLFARLSPRVGTLEKRMVEELVKKYAADNSLPFEKLLPMPLNKEPETNLAEQLSGLYGIHPENVAVSLTGLFDPVAVAWSMSPQNTDDLMVALKNMDLDVTLKLEPQGETPEMNIPARISITDEHVLGRIDLSSNWRSEGWTNRFPFPVTLKYLHALFIRPDESGKSAPCIYSWSLSNTEVPVQAKVDFKAETVPALVDQEALNVWVEYKVNACEPCKDEVINSLTGGTTQARKQQVEITSYVKDDLQAHVIEVTFRSPMADPKGEKMIQLTPVKLKEDYETYTAGPFYVPEGKSLEYEYKIKIVTDEEIYRSDWTFSKEFSLDLNKQTIRELLGKYPGE